MGYMNAYLEVDSSFTGLRWSNPRNFSLALVCILQAVLPLGKLFLHRKLGPASLSSGRQSRKVVKDTDRACL